MRKHAEEFTNHQEQVKEVEDVKDSGADRKRI
jgi:hypothetical protein